MKFLKISILFCLLGLLAVYGCKKDAPSTIEATDISNSVNERADEPCSEDYAINTSEIGVKNGRLHFPNYDVLKQTIASLDCIAEDEALNESTMTNLGYDDLADRLVPEVPALELFNSKYPSVKSQRQLYDEVEYQIDQGEEEEDEINKVLFWDPVLGSLINAENEIQIGNFIYKYLDDHQTLIYHDDDATSALVQNSTDLTKLEDGLNLFLIDTRNPLDIEYYEKFEALSRAGDCDINVTWAQEGDNFRFHVVGIFPNSIVDIDWEIVDGNGVILYATSAANNPYLNYTAPANPTLPLTVKVRVTSDDSGDFCETEGYFMTPPAPPATDFDCSSLNFSHAMVTPNTIRLIIPPNTPSLTWAIGTQSYTSPATGAIGGSFNFLVTNNNIVLPFIVCATVVTENCTNTVCRTLADIGCGTIDGFRRKAKLPYCIGYRRYKFRFQLRDPLFGASRVVTKNKHYDPTFLSEADQLKVELNGSGPGIGDLIWYDQNCILREQYAATILSNAKKIINGKDLSKHAKFRKGDDKCRFTIVETLPPGALVDFPGIPNPFTVQVTL